MSNFNNKTITSKGLELLSSALAGNTLEFTRIVMGSGTYEGDIGLIESLVNQKQSLDIKSITRKGSQVVLSTTLLQSAIIEDFYWKEIGVYAKGSDGLEILYMYGSANEASYISKNMLNEKMINIGVLVSNATNITATINNSLVYLNQNDLEEHNNDEEAHTPIRTWVQGLFNGLKLTWDNIIGKPSTFPPSSHSHTKSQITDFPTSLPASDVYDWAKAPTKPTYTYTEVGALASNGKAVSSATADSATYAGGLHIYNEITGLKSTVVDGKQSVANAINGHLGTTLSNQTPFADLAYYINTMVLMPAIKSSFYANYPGSGVPVTLYNTVVGCFFSRNGCTVTCSEDCYVFQISDYAPQIVYGTQITAGTTSSKYFSGISGFVIVCKKPATITLSPGSNAVSGYTIL
ncbi:phage tail-collar fiber domain-containing protein [Cellulosilyticum lentocellum]|uniref:Phage tail fibre protein N-terminal domain-containing protein n=1 Tax=Cellulosilyticum lentocellum (strain ATCC 49066 / DSM 5427 / NCIMB 11756 / RHM5) TaxID=642492 RepID=F2JK24_CELLD|nr:phage tail protein [Cellulosilyticum lentocellum]ADZ84439.1 hypothetical protein Clole_2739 [Cellulosilyticum lentocellum DSM 5427]